MFFLINVERLEDVSTSLLDDYAVDKSKEKDKKKKRKQINQDNEIYI